MQVDRRGGSTTGERSCDREIILTRSAMTSFRLPRKLPSSTVPLGDIGAGFVRCRRGAATAFLIVSGARQELPHATRKLCAPWVGVAQQSRSGLLEDMAHMRGVGGPQDAGTRGRSPANCQAQDELTDQRLSDRSSSSSGGMIAFLNVAATPRSPSRLRVASSWHRSFYRPN